MANSMLLLLAVMAMLPNGEASEQQAYIVYMGSKKSDPLATLSSHHQLLAQVKGSLDVAKNKILYNYKHGFSGFAAMLSSDEAAALSGMPGVVSVFRNEPKKLHTTLSWDFLGLVNELSNSVTLSSDSLWNKTDFGHDVIIGSLDTGVWPESSSYDDSLVGPIPKRWKGWCMNGTQFSSTNCNRKLIGAKYFSKGYEAWMGSSLNESITGNFKSPRDADGHGTHTSSTAGGSFVEGANLLGFANGTAKGGAPAARIAVYKVCWDFCYDADLLAAYDEAIQDGVDVLSISLGAAPQGSYLEDSTSIATFHALEHGIMVVCSAGNSGPFPYSVQNVAPWILTVAASTIDRRFESNVTLGNNITFRGESLSPTKLENMFYSLISGTAAGSRLCMLDQLDPDLVKGKIVACERGFNPRTEKGEAVRQAGGAGMILYNTEEGNELVADPHVLPATHVTAEDGEEMMNYINMTESPLAYFSPVATVVGVHPSPMMVSFSSRGPNPVTPQIIKPDITAPGVSILASYSKAAPLTSSPQDDRHADFNVLSGTSMSCPHVAGIAALLKALHPDWSPGAIKSAIMTTASIVDNDNKGILDSDNSVADAFVFGAGHINPNTAGDPGLVYNISIKDYADFLCAWDNKQLALANLDVDCPTQPIRKDLNYPSIAVLITSYTTSVVAKRNLTSVCEGEETYRATLDVPNNFTVGVMPSELSFSHKGDERSFTVTFQIEEGTLGLEDSYYQGWLTWTSDKHRVRSPLVVLNSTTSFEFSGGLKSVEV